MTEALAKMNIEDAVAKLITPGGKQLEVVQIANSSLYALRFKGGGELPHDEGIEGKWTSPQLATNAAQDYLRRFWEKTVKKEKKPVQQAQPE